MARFANLSVGLSVESSNYRRGLNQAQTTTRTFGQRLTATLQGTTGGFFNLQRVATAAATAITAAIAGYTVAALRANDEIVKQARNIGFSSESFQRYSVALQQADVNQTSFVRAAQQITRSIGDAEQGLMANIRAYEQLGLNFRDLATLSPEEQFREVVLALENTSSATTRASAGAVVLGRAWRSIGTLVDQGLDNVLLAAQSITTASSEAIQSAENINDSWLRVSTTIQNRIGNVTLPILERFLGLVEDIAGTRLNEEVLDVIDNIRTAGRVAIRTANNLSSLYNRTIDLVSGIENLTQRSELYEATLVELQARSDANSASTLARIETVRELLRFTRAEIMAETMKAEALAKTTEATAALAAQEEKDLMTKKMLLAIAQPLIDQADPYAAAVRAAEAARKALTAAQDAGAITDAEAALALSGVNKALADITPGIIEIRKQKEEDTQATKDLQENTNNLIREYFPLIGATEDASKALELLNEARGKTIGDGAEYEAIEEAIMQRLREATPEYIAQQKAIESVNTSLESLAGGYRMLTSEQAALEEADEVRAEALRLGIELTEEQIAGYARLTEAARLSAEEQMEADRIALLNKQASEASLQALDRARLSSISNVAAGVAGLAEAVGAGSREAFLISKAAALAQVFVDYAIGQTAAVVAGIRASVTGGPGVGAAVTAALLTSLNIGTALSVATIAAQTLTGLQTGGRVTRGGLFTVGEQGPENVFLPGNAQVAAAGSALGPDSGGSRSIGDVTIINQVGPNVSPRQVGDSTGRRFLDFVNNGSLDSGSIALGRQRVAI